jgi:hypothetical protein
MEVVVDHEGSEGNGSGAHEPIEARAGYKGAA